MRRKEEMEDYGGEKNPTQEAKKTLLNLLESL